MNFPDCSESIKIHRVGQYKLNRNRPIKVYFISQEAARKFLRNKSIIKEPIRIYHDQTPHQQQYIKKLVEELQQRTLHGEKNLTIKYINNTPKIIKQQTKN